MLQSQLHCFVTVILRTNALIWFKEINVYATKSIPRNNVNADTVVGEALGAWYKPK